jgi:dihydroflavonol-4-reductase
MILVTGGTGLVGAHLLIHLIEKGEAVNAIYRNSESLQKTESLFSLYQKKGLFESIHWVQADILNVPSLENAFKGIKQVYHCAALISFDPKDEDLVRKTNIEGTANIVNLCLAYKIEKLCHLSSIAALGDLTVQETLITEETEWNPEKPHSDYAISKYGAEMEVYRGQQEGLPSLILNPGVILGPGFWEQGSGTIFAKVKKGLSFYTKGKTGFIAVSDVARIAYELMKSDIYNERFTLVAENIKLKDFLNTVADALKVKRPAYYASPFLMQCGWRIDWALATLFNKTRELTRATAKASYSKNDYCNLKIKKQLNTEFEEINQYVHTICNL